MRELPERIWLQGWPRSDTTWCAERINDDDVEYVRASRPLDESQSTETEHEIDGYVVRRDGVLSGRKGGYMVSALGEIYTRERAEQIARIHEGSNIHVELLPVRIGASAAPKPYGYIVLVDDADGIVSGHPDQIIHDKARAERFAEGYRSLDDDGAVSARVVDVYLGADGGVASAPEAWLPISSYAAGEHGTNVLVAVPSGSGGFDVGEATYYPELNSWWWAGNDPTDAHGSEVNPTHWRPLPAPPVVGARAA